MEVKQRRTINFSGSADVGDQYAGMNDAPEVKDKREEEDENVSDERKRVILDVAHRVEVGGGLSAVEPRGRNPAVRNKHEGDDTEEDAEENSSDQLKSHYDPEESKQANTLACGSAESKSPSKFTNIHQTHEQYECEERDKYDSDPAVGSTRRLVVSLHWVGGLHFMGRIVFSTIHVHENSVGHTADENRLKNLIKANRRNAHQEGHNGGG